MARPLIDISAVLQGDRETEKMFRRMDADLQKKIFRKAARKSAQRLLTKILLNMSGKVIDEITGTFVNAFEGVKPSVLPKKPGYIGIGIKWPTREALGIDAKDKNYFPYAVEYGHPGAPPRPFFRNAINENMSEEIAHIGRDVSKALVKIAARASRYSGRGAA